MIRLATPDDAAAIREVYRPSIEESAASFEMEVPSIDKMRNRIEHCLRDYPWLVFDDEQGVCGYAYAGPHHPRAAYRWTANVSVYVDRRAHRQGIARRLYLALFKILEQQGVRSVLAGISVPNPASHAFHEALGFQQVGSFPGVGYKQGQWLDVSWWSLPLGEGADGDPSEFVPLRKLGLESIVE